MPEKRTMERGRMRAKGKRPTTQAGKFVREEIEHIREGKHGARSAKQAIAIGLSKARQAGVKLAPPKPGEASEETREKARREIEARSAKKASAKRSRRMRCNGKAGNLCPRRYYRTKLDKPRRAGGKTRRLKLFVSRVSGRA